MADLVLNIFTLTRKIFRFDYKRVCRTLYLTNI